MKSVPTLPLVAHVPVEVKLKAQRVAQQKGISLKDLLVRLILDFSEAEKK